MLAYIQHLSQWAAQHLSREQRGQDLIEYAILGGFIAAALIAVGTFLAITGALQSMGAGIGACIDFDPSTDCGPW